MAAAILIATAGYFSDQVLRGTIFVGCEFPIAVFGPLVLLLVVLSFLKVRLRRSGLAVVLTAALVACNIPGGGLLRMLTRSLGMPIQFNENNTAWENAEALRRIPPVLLPNGGRYDKDFMESFLYGSKTLVGPDKVPWDKWAGPLAFWWPLAFLLGFASICLGLIVHRQWSQRERLRYPIAEFTNTLLDSQGRLTKASVFRDSLFWLGLVLLLGLHVVNGLARWYPDRAIVIPLEIDLGPVLARFPKLATHWVANCLFGVRTWPMMVAFGFLIAADVSLSLGLSQVLWVAATAWLVHGLGFQPHGADDLGAPCNWQRAGSCLGLGLIILYTGRRYYWQVLRRALCFSRRDEVEAYAAWACRLFIISMIVMVAMLHSVGLPWPMATLLIMLIMLIYLIQARINTESGLILSLLTWMPSTVLLGLFGAKALGIRPLAICALVGTIFARDTHECLMPFFLNALRISESQGIKPGRAGSLAAVAFLLAIAVGVPFGLLVDHNYGVTRGESFATNAAPRWTIDAVVTTVEKLGPDEAAQSEEMSTFQRIVNMKPDRTFLWSLAIGFALVVAVSALRLRFAWWPIHPMMFLVWGTWAMAMMSHSLLAGWIVKKAVTRFGGTRTYDRARCFMFGVIAGEMLGGLLWLVVGAIYFAATGQNPPRYQIFPSGG